MNESVAVQPSAAGRIAVLVYAVLAYVVGMGGVICLILVLAGLLPWGFLLSSEPGLAVLCNLVLVAVWGVIHSVMARQGFKRWLTGLVPEPAERATYVLIAGLTTIVLTGFWQTVPGTFWQVDGQLSAGLLWALFVFGWLYLVAATFAINHFDLFGLRQAYYHFMGKPRPGLEFVKRAMYRVTRHPIQTGVLIGVWSTPEMTMTQLILSLGFTIYIFIGLRFEERDLIRDFGDTYEAYRGETGMVLPRLRPAVRSKNG